ncbi:hypothetical protein [Pedomonas mirosovicensis]|uniref:hypothetical protein n=1 Tax=Pedomonas mirosovicensis TaxID=2908641 RepID=UPI002168F84C|nr:hypothetical protein [Pedomonas mirosovicensis]MCH8685581.1 hypothetical protein [Pedomonas mirosovicensis]
METTILTAIEALLRTKGIAPSRFGRAALNDPRLVFDLRRGRQLTPANAGRIRACLQRLGAEG